MRSAMYECSVTVIGIATSNKKADARIAWPGHGSCKDQNEPCYPVDAHIVYVHFNVSPELHP